MVQNCDFQVRGYSPPYTKKIFFADLHDLGHERKKIKKVWKWPNFGQTPPLSVKFHTFFFRVRTSLSLLWYETLSKQSKICNPWFVNSASVPDNWWLETQQETETNVRVLAWLMFPLLFLFNYHLSGGWQQTGHNVSININFSKYFWQIYSK